jgi:hypothetical protein
VSVPGVIAMLVAPIVAQVSVLLDPDLMLAGLAAKDVTVGAEPVTGMVVVGSGLLDEPPHPVRPVHARRTRATAQRASPPGLRAKLAPSPAEKVRESKRHPSIATTFIVIARLRWAHAGMTESRNASRIFCNSRLGRRFATAPRLFCATRERKRVRQSKL